ncbi:helix-turn-helix transcriptional regulator, partial [Planotetraspora phitsanulokensis]
MNEISTGDPTRDLAQNLRGWRKRRGLTQAELAIAAKVSKSLVQKIEQGIAGQTTLETVHRLAIALKVPTTELVGAHGDAREPHTSTVLPPEVWEQTGRALAGKFGYPDEEPTVAGVSSALDSLKPLLAGNQYREVAHLLPSLIRDADALNGAGRGIRSRVLNTAGWVLTQVRQFELAGATLHHARDAAEDHLDEAAAVNTLVWLRLREGRLDDARRLATEWADRIEPRMSRATERELTLWGRLVLGISNAAVRDNRPGEAADTIRLAQTAATAVGREVLSDTSTTRTFGPVTVAMIRAENAAVQDRPDEV